MSLPERTSFFKGDDDMFVCNGKELHGYSVSGYNRFVPGRAIKNEQCDTSGFLKNVPVGEASELARLNGVVRRYCRVLRFAHYRQHAMGIFHRFGLCAPIGACSSFLRGIRHSS